MDEHAKIIAAAQALVGAIAGRRADAVRNLLAPDFVLRTPGGGTVNASEFIRSIGEISAEILLIRLEEVAVDVFAHGALVSGIQYAQIRLEGETFHRRRPYADWFVKNAAGNWQVRVALDLPELQ
jgi:ketosteroid isomerase-like protein